MNTNAKDINLIIQNADSIGEHPRQRKTALLEIRLNHSHIQILKRLNDENLQFYTEILSSETQERMLLENLKETDSVLLDISPSFLKDNFNFNFYFSFDDFIKKNNVSLTDEYFYILDPGISSFDKKNEYLKIYNSILSLQEIFIDISDHLDDESEININTYTFFDTKKINIKSSYKFEDLETILKSDKKIDQNNKNRIETEPTFGIIVSNLYEALELKNEKKIKSIFFKKAIEITFSSKYIDMSDILKNIDQIFEEYESHYRSYINSLEPEKIKHKFQEEHNSFLKELNTILGDVHNKIIFIPIAFIFGASQLTSGTVFKGLIIIAGMLIFSLFVALFLDTHLKVLAILDNKIEEKEEHYQQKEPSLYKNYINKIAELKDLSKNIRNRIMIIRYSNWTLTLGAAIFFTAMQ